MLSSKGLKLPSKVKLGSQSKSQSSCQTTIPSRASRDICFIDGKAEAPQHPRTFVLISPRNDLPCPHTRHCTVADSFSQCPINGTLFLALKALTSLNRRLGVFSYATKAFGVFLRLLPLTITAFGGPEGCLSLAIIAFEECKFIVTQMLLSLRKNGQEEPRLLLVLRRLRCSRCGIAMSFSVELTVLVWFGLGWCK